MFSFVSLCCHIASHGTAMCHQNDISQIGDVFYVCEAYNASKYFEFFPGYFRPRLPCQSLANPEHFCLSKKFSAVPLLPLLVLPAFFLSSSFCYVSSVSCCLCSSSLSLFSRPWKFVWVKLLSGSLSGLIYTSHWQHQHFSVQPAESLRVGKPWSGEMVVWKKSSTSQ